MLAENQRKVVGQEFLVVLFQKVCHRLAVCFSPINLPAIKPF